jgi:hypothetical protein
VLIGVFPPLGSSGQRVASTFVTGEQRSHRQSVSRISTVQNQFRIPSYLFFSIFQIDFATNCVDQRSQQDEVLLARLLPLHLVEQFEQRRNSTPNTRR